MIFETKKEKKDYFFHFVINKTRENADENINGILKTKEKTSSAAVRSILSFYGRDILIVSIRRVWKDGEVLYELMKDV